ncbi:fimbrin [Exophiala xenobiotica]|nr:fimbrin [Exophiala xenobiotica]
MAGILKLQRKYPQFPQNEIFQLQDAFRKLDVDDKGYLDEATVIKATQQSERQSYDVVRQALKEVELDSSRRVELEDYVDLISKVRGAEPPQQRAPSGQVRPAAGNGMPSHGHASKPSLGGGAGKIHVQGSSANVTHTINEEERTAFTTHINAVLAGDSEIGHLLPFPTDTFEMFDHCKDGLVLAKLINDSVPDTIDERVLNIPGRKIKTLNAFHMTENNNIVIESAKGIGCSVVNIGSGDIIEAREHLILGLIWQIIRRGLLGKIDIKLHPELYRLLEDDETLEQFLRLPPEQILLRWFNYHLKNAGWQRRVNNFSGDVKDGENYTVLLNQLKPDICSRAPLQTRDLLQRAEQVLENAEKIECRKFLTPKALVAGNPKLNLAFVANLFNTHPGLDPLTEEEKPEIEDFDAEGEREARVFTLWLNSLDVQPTINNFWEDLRDGNILLQAYDKVIPGSVNWRHVNKPPAHGGEMSRFKMVENTNYVVELGKQNRFSLVGIQGADLTDGQRTLTLGLVWQLMRRDIVSTLSGLAQRMGKRDLSDSDMVRWANDMSRKGGKNSSVRTFRDQAITSGIYLLDVLNGMKSNYVDYDLVTPGKTQDDAYANAKLSISIARKMDDIVQGRARLVTTFVGALMRTAEKMGV